MNTCQIVNKEDFERLGVYASDCGYYSRNGKRPSAYALSRVLFIGGITQFVGGEAQYAHACAIIDDHYRQRIKKDESEYQALEEQADKLWQMNEELIRLAALLAHERRRDPEAMKILTARWGKSARKMAEAVNRWPEEFVPGCGNSVQDFFVLFDLASLGQRTASEIMTQRKALTLSWQDTRALVEAALLARGCGARYASGIVFASNGDTVTIRLNDPQKCLMFNFGAPARVAVTVKQTGDAK